MDISGFGISSTEYYAGYVRKKEKASDMVFSGLLEEDEEEKTGGRDALPEKEEGEPGSSQAQIVVKPDGTRVLMVTTRVCGMETTISLKLSDQESMLHMPKMGGFTAMEEDNPALGGGA